MNTLYEIAGAYMKAFDELQIDPETGEIVNAEEFEAIEDAFEEKAENTALYIKNLEALAAAMKDEEKALADRRRVHEKKIDYLKGILSTSMEAMDKDRFESARVRIGFRKSQSVQIMDEKALPAQYIVETVSTKPDKAAIKAAIKAGHVVSGATLVESRSIQIK